LDPLISLIDAEIARLQQIRSMLTTSPAKRGPGRPPKNAVPAVSAKPKKKRTLSKEARQRIRDAQNKRWAAVKKAKTAVKPTKAAKKATKTSK
jgi:hypothetical protein